MSREIEKWLGKIATDSVLYDAIIKAYNLGLQDAVDNAKIKEEELETESYSKADEFVGKRSYSYIRDSDGCLVRVETFEVDKENILKLKL